MPGKENRRAAKQRLQDQGQEDHAEEVEATEEADEAEEIMPFKSKRQRDFLKIHHPNIYRRWKNKYGTKIRKGRKKK